MGRLSRLGQRALNASAERVATALKAAKNLQGELRELLDTPIDGPIHGRAAPSDADPRPPVASAPVLGDSNKPAQVFGRDSCPWTGRVRALLEREGASFEFIDLDAPEYAALDPWLVTETKQNTNPYVFLRGRFIGGFNALDEVVRLGQLAFEMQSAEERARHTGRIRIEIAPRDDNGRPPPGEN
jgi:glutaredoxin